MKKLISAVLILTIIGVAPANAKKIKYVKQKAGQFCKVVDVKNFVILPDGSKIVCTKELDANRARWKNA